jgi:hypothetical protein
MSLDTVDATVAQRPSCRGLTPLYWAGIVLAAVTGGLHLWLGITDGKIPLAIAGIGFAVGTAAVVLDVRRRQFVEYGIPFTPSQVVLYAVGHYPDAFAAIELFDKAVQVALVAVLVVLRRRA